MSVEVCTIKGLVTQYILFFIDIASRSVHVAGITPHPDYLWMTQIARNITTWTMAFFAMIIAEHPSGSLAPLDFAVEVANGCSHTGQMKRQAPAN